MCSACSNSTINTTKEMCGLICCRRGCVYSYHCNSNIKLIFNISKRRYQSLKVTTGTRMFLNSSSIPVLRCQAQVEDTPEIQDHPAEFASRRDGLVKTMLSRSVENLQNTIVDLQNTAGTADTRYVGPTKSLAVCMVLSCFTAMLLERSSHVYEVAASHR